MLTPNPWRVCPFDHVRRPRGRAGSPVGGGNPASLSLRLIALPVLALAAALGGRAGAPAGRPVWVEREAYLMGTRLRARVAAGGREEGARSIEAAFEAVRRVEGMLSTWRDDTELQRLNAAPPGETVTLSRDLSRLLAEADRWRGATGGAFDPGIGALVDAWDLRGAGRRPTAGALATARAASGLRRFAPDPSWRSARRTGGAVWIDAGGFGKGAALREARVALVARGVSAAILNFGGQVLALGGPEHRDGWTVPVAHPSRRSESAAVLLLSEGSAATSSQSERSVGSGGARIGHLLDPRTGRPAPAWGSVTVVVSDPMVADILSTALFVLGPADGMRWLADRRDIAALFLVESGGGLEARWNPPMRRFLLEAPPR